MKTTPNPHIIFRRYDINIEIDRQKVRKVSEDESFRKSLIALSREIYKRYQNFI